MVAYYVLGGPYSIQLDANVRMDLLYGRWSPRTKAWVDAFSVLFLIYFLGVLLWRGVGSTWYSLEYGERSPPACRPYPCPIKLVMCVRLALMILQAVAAFFKDIARIPGQTLVSTRRCAPPCPSLPSCLCS